MSKKNNQIDKITNINEINIKETIEGFIKPEEENKSQEQEILDFQLKKKKKLEKQLLEDEEKKRKEEEEEEEELKRIKEELLQSLRKRIPEIEKRFAPEIPTLQSKSKGKEHFRTREIENDKVGQQELDEKVVEIDEKERE